VRQLSQRLKKSIDVVGVGGVMCGMDAFEHILCGAAAVQVGTCHRLEGPKCFNRIIDELEAIMARKGYKTIDEFRGKLRDYDKDRASKTVVSVLTEKDKKGGAQAVAATDDTNYVQVIAFLCVIIAALLIERVFGRNVPKVF
jgi:dihydroorotate dehydrogenase (fumarate)